jgi:hypothetical protein
MKNEKKIKKPVENVEIGKETSMEKSENTNPVEQSEGTANESGEVSRTDNTKPNGGTEQPDTSDAHQQNETGTENHETEENSETENPEPKGDETNVNTEKRKYKKRVKSEPSEKTEPLKSPDFDVFSDLEQFAKSTKEPIAPEKTPIITKGKKSKNDMLITGYMLLIFCDLAIPTVICLVYKMSGQGEVKATDLQLEKEQLDSLIPIADAAAKELMFHVNPVWMFFGALSGMYLSKLYMVTQ